MTESLKYPAGKIYLGSDESTYDVKIQIKNLIKEKGFLVVDLGSFDINEIVDYSELAREVAEKVLENEKACEPTEPVSTIHGCKSVGILLNSSGVGMLTAVSKMNGIVPSLCTSVEMATMAKNKSANILCIGMDEVNLDLAKQIVQEFLT
jgi:ribose 5-phosphate isomerase RpiB